MKFVSFNTSQSTSFGVLVADQVIDLGARLGLANLGEALQLHSLEALQNLADRHAGDFSIDDITAYRPVVADPDKIFCVGLNYDAHVKETNRERTTQPTLFLRLAASQVGHQQALVVPPESHKFDYEGEIAVVIGKPGRRIPVDKAFQHVAGLACYNDASVRDWQTHTSQWTPGKNFEGTGGFGPWLVDTSEVGENDVLTLETRLNGQIMQQAGTDMLIFSIPELIHYISIFITLKPGDVIVTGTPGGVGVKREPPVFMKDGDLVEVEVSKLGILKNPIRAE